MILILLYFAYWSPVLALVGSIFLYRQHCKARPTHTIPVLGYAAIILDGNNALGLRTDNISNDNARHKTGATNGLRDLR
jgi:hypothetical protein